MERRETLPIPPCATLDAMTTYRVYDIQWETDGKSVPGLPVEVVIDLDEDPSEDAENDAVNRVSDDHGWLIADCKIEQVT